MSRRPIVTYAGDNSLFTGLQASLVSALPQENVEWRRSYGRPSRCVHVEVDFVPFSDECLVKDSTRTILGQPIFHTFWTNCADVEAYKNTMRDNLQAWIASLRQQAITDWMVVLIETPDTRKGNKLLPRTTVLDKIKNDFGGKHADRCVALIDPLKTDTRSVESWQTLLTKMRHFLMIAYNRALNRFEENMRAERERRIEKSWSFCSYFLLQEELAQVFSLLALHDEALVQYDELDALFTQFVLNSAAGDSPSWLSTFNQACEKWEGLHLTPELDVAVQGKIRSKEVTLIEFRNYLFQRQCALLFLLSKPWEVASRALTFLHNTVGELNILEISVAPGGVACWGVLSCLEIIDALHSYKEPSTMDAHALHTAPLWAYARDK
ncbi:Trafficking protein particle complex subunit 10, partial [Halocaridina rubra]